MKALANSVETRALIDQTTTKVIIKVWMAVVKGNVILIAKSIEAIVRACNTNSMKTTIALAQVNITVIFKILTDEVSSKVMNSSSVVTDQASMSRVVANNVIVCVAAAVVMNVTANHRAICIHPIILITIVMIIIMKIIVEMYANVETTLMLAMIVTE